MGISSQRKKSTDNQPLDGYEITGPETEKRKMIFFLSAEQKVRLVNLKTELRDGEGVREATIDGLCRAAVEAFLSANRKDQLHYLQKSKLSASS